MHLHPHWLICHFLVFNPAWSEIFLFYQNGISHLTVVVIIHLYLLHVVISQISFLFTRKLTALISRSSSLLSQLSGQETSASWLFTIVPVRHSLNKNTHVKTSMYTCIKCCIKYVQNYIFTLRKQTEWFHTFAKLRKKNHLLCTTCRRCGDTLWARCPLLAAGWRSRWDSLPLWCLGWGFAPLLPTNLSSSSLVPPFEPSSSRGGLNQRQYIDSLQIVITIYRQHNSIFPENWW